MPMRTSAERHREVMIRVGLDPSQMEIPAEKAKQYMQELTNLATVSNRTVAQSAKDATVASERVVNTLGRMRLRRAPITLMTTEFAQLANQMDVLRGSGNLVRTGMYTLTSAMSGFVGPIGIATIAITGLAAAFLLKRRRIEESTKAVKDNTGALLSLAQAGDEQAKTILRGELQKAEEELLNLRTQAYFEGLKQTEQIKTEKDAYLGLAKEGLGELNKRIDKMLGNWKGALPVSDEAKKKYAELEAKILDLRKALAELDEELPKHIKIIEQAPELRGGVVPFVPTVEPIDESKIIEARNRLVEIWSTAPPVMYDDWNEYWEDVERLNRRHQQAVIGYVDNISAAFSNAFVGIETDWGRMLQNMVAQLAQSGLTSLIMSLLFPAKGFGGWFSEITGFNFQQGTPFVPRTGWYQLHRGESVIPAHRNITNIRNQYGGATTQNFYLISLDVENLTRKKIMPLIEKASKLRQTKIMTA